MCASSFRTVFLNNKVSSSLTLWRSPSVLGDYSVTPPSQGEITVSPPSQRFIYSLGTASAAKVLLLLLLLKHMQEM